LVAAEAVPREHHDADLTINPDPWRRSPSMRQAIFTRWFMAKDSKPARDVSSYARIENCALGGRNQDNLASSMPGFIPPGAPVEKGLRKTRALVLYRTSWRI
jgi:hypothetical protein